MTESRIHAQESMGPEIIDSAIDSSATISDLSGISTSFKRLISFPAMLASLLVGAVFTTVRLFHVDPDLWWHVKVGDMILRTHHFPTTDIYSFTVHGQPWLAYEWLGEVMLAAAWRHGGIVGLEALLVVLASAIMLALYALGTLRTGNSKAAFIACAVLLILATVSFSMRPQMLGYLFLVLTLIALERFRQGHRRGIFFLPLLMLLWINSHGSWIIGLGAIFVYWMSGLTSWQHGDLDIVRWTPEQRRDISLVFLLSVAVLPITPYGSRLAVSPFEFAFSLPLNVSYIQEWQSMPFSAVWAKVFLFLIIAIICLQIVFRLRWRLEDLVLFVVGTVMAFIHIRFLLVWVPFFMPVLALTLSRWMDRYNPQKDKFALNAVLVACVAAGVIHYFPSRSDLDKSIASQFPSNAVAYLQDHSVPEPMFNNYGFGGYLIYARGPEHKVFIDGRGDIYERGGVLADYKHIDLLQPGALDVLRLYRIQSCLLQRDEPLATVLYASEHWQRKYIDSTAVIFVRKK